MRTLQDFFSAEEQRINAINIKKVYIDMCEGDIESGLVLSVISVWNIPDCEESKEKVSRGGEMWMPIKYDEWWDMYRLDSNQVHRAIAIIDGLGLIDRKEYDDCGALIRIIEGNFLKAFDNYLSSPLKKSPDGGYHE